MLHRFQSIFPLVPCSCSKTHAELYNLADGYSLQKIFFSVCSMYVCGYPLRNKIQTTVTQHLTSIHLIFLSALPLDHMASGSIMTVCLQITQQRQNFKEPQMMKNQNSCLALQPVSYFHFLFDPAWIINVGLARRYLRKQIQQNAITEKTIIQT